MRLTERAQEGSSQDLGKKILNSEVRLTTNYSFFSLSNLQGTHTHTLCVYEADEALISA